MKKLSEVLTGPAVWCQKYSALTADGIAVSVHSPAAAKWCLAGIWYKLRGINMLPLALVIRTLFPEFPIYPSSIETVHKFNDTEGRIWGEIKAVIDEVDKNDSL